MGQFCAVGRPIGYFRPGSPSSRSRLLRAGLVVTVLGLVAGLMLLISAPAAAAPASKVLVGTDRMHTAILVSQDMFPAGLPADSGLVLAPAETFQEALCGAPLASAYGGPVLLTYAVGLNNGVKDEMIRLAPEYVVCVGLPPGVVTEVTTAMGAGVTVTAINGTGGSVYDMSYRVAKALGQKLVDISDAAAIVTIGTNFPDALGVSSMACFNKWPVLLTNYADDRPLNASAALALSELGISKALKVGTYAALPGTVAGVGNLSGADRYYTNCNVAGWAHADAGLTFDHLGVTTGENFPDALAAGPYLGRDHGTLLLTKAASVPAPIADTLVAHAGEVDNVEYIGLAESGIWPISALLPGAPPPFTPVLSVGSSGPAVAWLEGRLTSLTYRPGPVDGVWDATKTTHGLLAFQKYEGLTRDGQVGADDWARLAVATKPVATQATTGTWIEVDKDRQVLLHVVGGVVTKTLDVSTGSPSVGIETPEGMFTIDKRWLGYFNGMYLLCRFYYDPDPPAGEGVHDIGIHGYSTVPTYPASHGCVRTNIWDQQELYPQLPLGMRIFIY